MMKQLLTIAWKDNGGSGDINKDIREAIARVRARAAYIRKNNISYDDIFNKKSNEGLNGN